MKKNEMYKKPTANQRMVFAGQGKFRRALSACVALFTAGAVQANCFTCAHGTGTYEEINYAGLCFDVDSFKGNGGQILLWPCHGGENQRFKFTWLGSFSNNTFTYLNLRAKHSGKCIDVPNNDWANGNKLQTWDCGAAGTTWAMHTTASGRNVKFFGQIKPFWSKLWCMDVPNGRTDWMNRINIHLWDCNSTGFQVFQYKGLSNQY